MYPKPKVPKSPVLGWSSFRQAPAPQSASHIPSVLSLPHRQDVTSARIAIAIALQRLGVGPGDRVLVPSFHCLSMVEPIIYLGAQPQFYPLDASLRVSVDRLERLDLANVKAMLVTHYFGFPQAMRSIMQFANAHGLGVIEDCAHTVFGISDGEPVGSWGDYAAVSLMKFFPVYDGGSIVSARHSLADLHLRKSSGRFEIKALLNTLERGVAYKRFPGIQTGAKAVFGMKDALWGGIKRARPATDAPTTLQDPAASDGATGFHPAWLDRRITHASHVLVDRLPLSRVINRRRHHYMRLLDGLAKLPGTRPFINDLPPDVVPYVFPLLVDDSETIFPHVKEAAIPLARWEGLWNAEATRIDPLSDHYTRAIFQLPCHQELDDDDVTWLIDRMHAVFAAAKRT